MTEYRVYQVDSSGKIYRGEDYIHISDQQVTAAALLAHPGKHLEIWSGARLVRVLLPRRH